MHSILRSAGRIAFPAMAAMALLQAESRAVVIKVFGPKATSDFASMKEAAATLRERWRTGNPAELAPSGTIGAYRYLLADATVIPRSFSMEPGTAAYFWSDNTFRFESGFRFQGGQSMAYGKPAGAKAPLEPPAKAPVAAYSTLLRGASLQGSSLRVDYALRTAAPVTLEILGVDGKRLAKWTWRDGAAGLHSRTFTVDRLPRKGTVLLRWSSGRSQAAQRLTLSP